MCLNDRGDKLVTVCWNFALEVSAVSYTEAISQNDYSHLIYAATRVVQKHVFNYSFKEPRP